MSIKPKLNLDVRDSAKISSPFLVPRISAYHACCIAFRDRKKTRTRADKAHLVNLPQRIIHFYVGKYLLQIDLWKFWRRFILCAVIGDGEQKHASTMSFELLMKEANCLAHIAKAKKNIVVLRVVLPHDSPRCSQKVRLDNIAFSILITKTSMITVQFGECRISGNENFFSLNLNSSGTTSTRNF